MSLLNYINAVFSFLLPLFAVSAGIRAVPSGEDRKQPMINESRSWNNHESLKYYLFENAKKSRIASLSVDFILHISERIKIRGRDDDIKMIYTYIKKQLEAVDRC